MYVVSNVWNRLSDYYRTLNPATLSGAIDIIVVQQPDASLNSSPFHARFGKIGILRPQDNAVDLYVNDELVPDIRMQLGEAGEAFFVVEEQEEQLDMKHLLCGEAADDSGSEGSSSRSSSSGGSSQPGSLQQQVSYYSDCESDDRQLKPSSRRGTLSGYKSESELEPEAHPTVMGPTDQLVAQLNWEWGKLPQSSTVDSFKSSSDFFDCNDEAVCDVSSSSGATAVNRSSESDRLSDSVGECYLSELDSKNRHLYISGLSTSPESGYKSDLDVCVEADLNFGVRMSLCGGLDSQQRGVTTERFLQHLVTYEEFMQNPDLVEHKDLVLRIDGRNYNWRAAGPLLLCRAAFGQALPHKAEQALRQRHMPYRRKRNTMRSWFTWGSNPIEDSKDEEQQEVTAQSSANHVPSSAEIKEAMQAVVAEKKKRRLVRSVRLSSDQLLKLKLRPGYNELRYSITTKYQGTAECTCGIYLWKFDDRLVVSDIDGTITKSDVLGHILPMVGKDWTQPRVAKLFSAIERNDYKFVYLSARAIGQSSVTRRFLQRVRQEGIPLPDGPVLLSPQSLLRAFHQEVIAKRPEAFKIACLKDVRALYPDGVNPFWAGFGNRPSDTLSYSEVGIPTARRFTVNPQGEVKKENSDILAVTYEALSEVADLMFPPPKQRTVELHDYCEFQYWREPLLKFQPGVTPALHSLRKSQLAADMLP